MMYECESPDELALIHLAKSMAYVLNKRDNKSIAVSIKGKNICIDLL